MSSSFVILLGVVSALRVPGPLSPRTASYVLHARLDAPKAEVHGTVLLRWRNAGDVPVRALPLHLYMNAFKNERSTYLREARWQDPPVAIERGRWGQCRVAAVAAHAAGADLHATLLLDPTEETLATVQLAAPVAPGATVELEATFTTKLPEIVSRAGADHGFFAVAQWFPKIAAYTCDPVCAFHARPYHADSEFFADFGTYDVTLDVPDDLVVGATGVRTGDEAKGGRRTLTYRAEDVHDFVWTADARFRATTVEVDDGSGLPPVTVRVLGGAGARAHVDRHLAAVRAGLAELGRRLGWYPYRELTVVQPPPGADEAGGMEYPTLFFASDRPAPSAILFPELVTAHELAHQWFQGMIASDEVDEPWLDEGLAERATAWVLARLAPPDAAVYRLAGRALLYTHSERAEIVDEHADPVGIGAAAFRDQRSYADEVYRKAALLLATLEARLGAAAFERTLRRYADRGRFAHPRTADFLAAFADAPPPLRALLADGVRVAASLDYAIAAVHTTPERAPRGLFDADGGVREDDEGKATGRHHSAIVVERLGELRAPVTLRAHLADGTQVDRALAADAPDEPRWRRVELESASPLAWAELHPDDDTPLDARRWNDGLRIEPDARPRRSIVLSLRVLAALALSWVGR